MSIKKAYDSWSAQYDTNHNRTRDLEAEAFKATLTNIPFDNGLEIGCGTGKNTSWLITKAKQITAVDLSPEMLAKAKEKITSDRVQFHQADILNEWTFTKGNHDLVSFSLVLEHIENLETIFSKLAKALTPGGYVYIGELHPFKQYAGSKAKFETEEGIEMLSCFNHHVTDFLQAGKNNGLELVELNEWFDDNDRTTIPRILTILLKKV